MKIRNGCTLFNYPLTKLQKAPSAVVGFLSLYLSTGTGNKAFSSDKFGIDFKILIETESVPGILQTTCYISGISIDLCLPEL